MRDHGSDSNWDDFKQILRNTFQSVDLDYRNRVKLTNLKQGSDSYNKNFLRLSTQLPNLRLDDLLFHYTNGLSEKVKYEAMSKAPKTMDAALTIATQYEHLHAHARPIVDVNAMSFRNRYNQGSSSGSRRFNTNPPSSDKPSCSYCHKRGHHINDCFSRQKATNTSQSNSNSHSNKSHTSNFSRRPGSLHDFMTKRKVRGMHSIQTNNSDQLFRVHGTVAYVTNLLCTLDSASSVSMMPESTAHHYKVPIHPSDMQIKSANNAVTSVVGVTDSLLIDIQGHSCQVTFIVLHHDDY
jgi:hypothetical protein